MGRVLRRLTHGEPTKYLGAFVHFCAQFRPTFSHLQRSIVPSARRLGESPPTQRRGGATAHRRVEARTCSRPRPEITRRLFEDKPRRSRGPGFLRKGCVANPPATWEPTRHPNGSSAPLGRSPCFLRGISGPGRLRGASDRMFATGPARGTKRSDVPNRWKASGQDGGGSSGRATGSSSGRGSGPGSDKGDGSFRRAAAVSAPMP